MAGTILVLIRDDPRKSHRAVEGLRIALGLSTGANPLTVVLLDNAPLLLTADSDERDDAIMDAEILEKHLPVLKELQLPFIVSEGTTARMVLDPGFTVREASATEIASLAIQADRVLIF